MSIVSAYSVRENSSTCYDIPYEEYFKFFPYEKWSLQHYVSLIIDNYEHAERDKAHHAFYSTLLKINDNSNASQEIRAVIQKLIDRKKVLVSYWVRPDRCRVILTLASTDQMRLL
ncbi:26324_t:CDS:2, partial [Gigaspora rosea]